MKMMLLPTKSVRREWEKWVRTRPEHVRKVAKRFNSWSLYRLKTTGQIVYLLQFDEMVDGSITIKVRVDEDLNPGQFARDVFGIDPNDLEEIKCAQ